MKRWKMRSGCAMTMCLFALAAIPLQADDNTQAPGPKVGESVPAFKLVDQQGEERTLKAIAGEHAYVAIVFHRSASW